MQDFPGLSREFFEMLFHNITSAIFIVDSDARIRSFNDSFRAIFFDDSAQIEGGYCGNVLGCKYTVEEDADCGRTTNCTRCEFRNSIFRTLIEKVPTNKSHLVRDFYIRGQSVQKHFQYSTRHIHFQGENMVLVVVDDITELEAQRRQLEELVAAKDRFFSILAHDLKGPLNTVLGFSSLLANHAALLTREEIIEQGAMLHQSVRNMYRLLENLLDWARSQTGLLKPDFELVLLNNLINENIELFQSRATEKGIQLVNMSKKPVMAWCDQNTMRTVVRNLVSNAIKFTPGGGQVMVRANRENGNAVLSVRDTGVGIDEPHLDNLFRIDYRHTAEGTDREKGTGIGLVLCQEFVRLNKGSISVISQKNAGTEFVVSLPSAPES